MLSTVVALGNLKFMQPLNKVFSVLSIIALSACNVAVENLSKDEMAQVIKEDRKQIINQVEPIGEVVTIDEAIARALKYNLDQRVANLEQSLRSGELVAGKYDMLPDIIAKAGYDWRNNFSHRWTGDYIDANTIPDPNILPTPPNVSVDPRHGTGSLALSWSLLDFGASYYTAKQNANKILVANEKRRKAMHSLVQEVRSAYWRALASEALSKRVKITIASAERALTDSRKLTNEGLTSPDQPLRYQRNLLENLRLLEAVEQELAIARHELTQLIGATQGVKYRLKEPPTNLSPVNAAMVDLEQFALSNNANLRKEVLNTRIAADDTRKAIIKLLPGVTLDYGVYSDNDRYLVNEQWTAAGINVSYNLFNLLSAKSSREAARSNENLAVARRMALQMAVITQVHVASHQYTDALKQFQRADQIYLVDRKLEKIVRGKTSSDMSGEQALIAANVTTILSEMRRYQAMAKFQRATGQLQSTLGMEPVFGSVDDITLADLRILVSEWLDASITVEKLALADKM